MELSAYEIAIIGVAGTILGSLVGAIIGYWLSVKLSKGSEKRASAYRLHMAFKDELLSLNSAESTIEFSLPEFLKLSFPKHRAAIYEYSFFLSKSARNKFEKAWQEYFRHDEFLGCELPFFEKYSLIGKSVEQQSEIKSLAASKIRAILAYAAYY